MRAASGSSLLLNGVDVFEDGENIESCYVPVASRISSPIFSAPRMGHKIGLRDPLGAIGEVNCLSSE